VKEQNLPAYYFAYGSNMNPERMLRRGARFKGYRRGVLKNYELRFNKLRLNGSAAANAVFKPGARLEGVLYELENPAEAIEALDRAEGYPSHYDRKILPVETPEGKLVDAVVYLAQPWVVKEGLVPEREYFEHLLRACGLGILTDEYCAELKRLYRSLYGEEPAL